jgi:hypothetical protein
MSYAMMGLGQEPRPKLSTAQLVGWGAVSLVAVGLFWGATSGAGMRPTPNRRRRRASKKRRTSRKARLRRNTRRTSLHSYKALTAAARSRMPASYFALSGKRWPIRGPKGSSRERDEWQALQAIRYLNMGRVASKQDYLAIRNAVIGRYGMDFWRSYDGPSWNKVDKARERRRRKRRTSRGRRRVAANRR